ncbi:MAG: hypothetical protein V7603_4174 [Micromonosporaceae bacterium]
MFGRKRQATVPTVEHPTHPPLWTDLLDYAPIGRHRLADGETVAVKGFPLRHGWATFQTQLLPLVQTAPLLTPGQRYRADHWEEQNS